MNTTATVQAPVAAFPTHRQSWVWYIAQQLARCAHFKDRDVQREQDIWDGLESYVHKNCLSGSGFDDGTRLSATSTSKRLVFTTAFHHMDENGGYDGWTEHRVIVTPTFQGFDIRVTGRDRNGIKDYIGETFHHWLSSDAEHPALIEHTMN